MPHAENAATRLAGAVARLAEAPPPSGEPPPVVRAFFAALDLGAVADLVPDTREPPAPPSSGGARPDPAPSLGAMLQDTITPTVIHVGSKANVIPGTGTAEVDVRTLPGTDQAAFAARLRRWPART